MGKSASSGLNKVGDNYYKTIVVEEEGIYTSTLYRTDDKGNNPVPIGGSASGGFYSINSDNANATEQQLLSDSNSTLRQTQRNQVKSTEKAFFGTDATSTEKSELEKAGGGSGNTAPSPSPEDTEGGNKEIQAEVINQEGYDTLEKTGIPGRSPKSNYGNMRYPKLMKGMDVVKFIAKTYGTRGFKVETLQFKDTRNFGTTLGTATLGIQPTISDQNTVNWSSQDMSFIEMALANASLSIIDKGAEGAKATLDSIINTMKLEPGAKNAIINLFVQEAAGTKGLLSRLTGAISNPNMELLFQGPQLRTFNFNFKLSPRSRDEAAEVKRIINFFKRNMAVQRSSEALFLKAPNVFDIQYLYAEGNSDHEGLNKIKGPCALTNCAVNYTPTGSYMTFFDEKNQSMVSYDLSLTFNELEPVYEDEYEGHTIGY
jgi:hypothetical protein